MRTVSWWFFAVVVAAPVAAQGPSLADFNPVPELPFSATSFELDEWFK